MPVRWHSSRSVHADHLLRDPNILQLLQLTTPTVQVTSTSSVCLLVLTVLISLLFAITKLSICYDQCKVLRQVFTVMATRPRTENSRPSNGFQHSSRSGMFKSRPRPRPQPPNCYGNPN